MILAELERDVWTRLNKPNPPDPQTQARIRSFINQRHRTLLTMPGLDQLRHETTTMTTVPGIARVAMGQAVNRIDAIIDPINNTRLIEKPLTWLRSSNPREDSGTPSVYVPLGYEYVAQQFPFDTELWAISTQAEDTSVLRIEGLKRVEAINTAAYLDTASATLNGKTSYVQLGTDALWSEVTKLFVSAPAVGRITLYASSSPGPVPVLPLASIRPGKFRPYYFAFLLWPRPSAERTYVVDYTRTIEDMVEDTDEPLLPRDFHDLLAIGARQDEYEKTDDQRFKTAVAEWNQRYAALQYFLQGRASTRIIPHGMRGSVGCQ